METFCFYLSQKVYNISLIRVKSRMRIEKGAYYLVRNFWKISQTFNGGTIANGKLLLIMNPSVVFRLCVVPEDRKTWRTDHIKSPRNTAEVIISFGWLPMERIRLGVGNNWIK